LPTDSAYPTSATMGESEQIRNYRAWIEELRRRRDVQVDRKKFLWFIVPGVVTAAIAAYWSVVYAAFTIGFWGFLAGASMYLATMHRFENDRQLEHAENELDLLLEAEEKKVQKEKKEKEQKRA